MSVLLATQDKPEQVEQAEKVNTNAVLFLQPEWSKKEEMTELIVDYVKQNPKWNISLQTHKYINVE